MRKQILGLILLVAAFYGYAPAETVFINNPYRFAGAAPAGCPVGTYAFAWDGDHASGNLVGCLNSGASTVTGTNTGMTVGATGEGGSIAASMSAVDQRISFGIANGDLDESLGVTVWIKAQFGTSDGTDNAHTIFEGVGTTYEAANHFDMRVQDTEVVRFYWAASNQSTTATITRDGSTWVAVGGTAIPDAGAVVNPDIRSIVGCAGTWANGNSNPAAFTAEITRLIVGNLELFASGADPVIIDEVWVINSLNAACPF